MPQEPPKPPEETGLLIRPSTGLVSLPDGGSPVLSEIINRALAHIQTSKALGVLHRIGEHELYWPDYQLVCNWAEELRLGPECVMEILLRNKGNTDPIEWQTRVVGGRFKNLRVGNKLSGIAGIPSIEGLVIERLDIGWAQFRSLDLALLPNLTHLDCGWNQLVELDLSAVPCLVVLNCWRNHLTELVLSSVPNLTELRCDQNELPGLDLSGVPNLAFLSCEYNELTELDLSGVPNLTELNCDHNRLTGLDLSGVPNLTGLHCDENQLTELCFPEAPNLTELYCDHNRLTGLDLSGVPNLRHFFAGGIN